MTESSQQEQQDTITRQRIESELDKNFIVEAAAGTGKTTSLVNRMVALVQRGTCRIDQLAAVTFTRKAAAELRERFQAALRNKATDSSITNPEELKRLLAAADQVNQAFVGTIHSFCATLLRERPIEFRVDPAFRELDEKDDRLLREQAWQENIADLIASRDPLLDQLRDLDINRAQLKKCFDQFIEYRDIENWPSTLPADIDFDGLQRATRAYIDEMRQLLPFFPADKGKDKLMGRYEKIVRSSSRAFGSRGRFFALLEQFNRAPAERQKDWPAEELGIKKLGGRERDRWNEFRVAHVEPAMIYWTRYRYQFVVTFLRRAVEVYERLKSANGGLDFQELLLTVANGLRVQPNLRTYFQGRFTNLLVDESQDTDPLQAQMMLFLTASDPNETDWTRCQPTPGALFLVGDPKQSIYRFRRGDIITYNRVKQIICDQGGEVLPLVKNFRSQTQLREWNNRVYRAKFGDQPTNYSPAAEDMIQGREDALLPDSEDNRLCGTYRLQLPVEGRIEDVQKEEGDSIAKFIRHAIDTGLQVARTPGEQERGIKTQVQPRDFLIVPWRKRGMAVYTDALEKYGVPYQVSGGNPLLNNPQLSALVDCLRAIDDPTNPIHYLSVLRKFFGFSDRQLYLFKQAGGSLNHSLPVPDGLSDELTERFEEVSARFRQYQAWMRGQPYATAVSQIATDLGVIAASAATDEGDMQAGGLMKVIEWLRSQSWDFDSATDLVQFLEEVLEADDADACRALPSDGNVVRLMNLHKAKGLEAPIVFLADTSAKFGRDPECHIDRSGESPVGYMGISTSRKVNDNFWLKTEVATPENWSAHQAEEQRFLDAEHDRSLYVATTRAACATIVSAGKDNSNWASLVSSLGDAQELKIPETVSAPAPSDPISFHPSISEQITKKWSQSLSPSYSVTTAKKLGLKGKSRPDWEASGDYGHEWGSAVHELLEVCHKSPKADLRPTALRLARDYNLGSSRADELINTVQSVTASDIWKRAQASKRCYSELPFETTITGDDGKPQIVRGVIDLIFEEEDGWVIVDYKTDDVDKFQVDSAVNFYRNQVSKYAAFWEDFVRCPPIECGLFFTRISEYHFV